MDNVSLRDIEDIARLESAKMQHFYVGVEHLFIALTKLDGGLVSTIFEQNGFSARYMRFATRELTGRGDDRRYWPGYRVTPRATDVIERAQALIDKQIQPDERALLLAIIEEGQSIPIRAMQESGVEIALLRELAVNWHEGAKAHAPAVPIDGGESFPPEVRAVLHQMFQKYSLIEIEHIFAEGLSFSGAMVMLVRPIHADGRSDAPVVVKIAERQAILSEKKRYDTYVRDSLPPTTARVESDPSLPEKSPLGGLKYTFVRLRGEDMPINMHEFAAHHDADDVAGFIRESLFDGFREAWWGQARPYRFTAWQEYEFLLPAALIVESAEADTNDPAVKVLRPLDDWSRTGNLHAGDLVELENFTVQKIRRSAGGVQIAAGAAPESINRSGQVEVRGLDLTEHNYYRGELVKRFTGRVVSTRDDLLQEQVLALEPNFNPTEDSLPYINSLGDKLPNPMRRYSRILDMRLSGTLSTVHGDLHMGNVLIGPGGDAWLIDFEMTRDGHTLFDWAMLETSLLIDYVAMLLSDDWLDAMQVIRLIEHINRKQEIPETEITPIAQAIIPILEVRSIVHELLADSENWAEYYVPLSLCALRVIGWKNRPLAARRLSFLASALAMDAARNRNRSQSAASMGDLTDATTDLN